MSCLLLLAALAAAAFLPRISSRQVSNTIEARVAITSREMWRSGDWILPRMNGQLRLQKPPLAYWLSGLSAAAQGRFDELTLRLPFFFVVLGTAFFTFLLGAELWRRDVGLLAAVVLLTSPLFGREGQMATADNALIFCACGAWYFHIKQRKALEAGAGTRGWALLSFAFLGLGVLAKGPVILAINLLPVLLEALVSRSRAPLRALWSPAGIVLFLGIGVLWPTLVVGRLVWLDGWQKGTAALNHWFFESFGKVAELGDGESGLPYAAHPGPWHFYLPRLLSTFGAWSVVLPFALLKGLVGSAGARLRRDPAAPDGGALEGQAAPPPGVERAPLFWFLTVLFFFSFVREKKWAYVLPLVPAGSLLVAGTLAGLGPRLRTGLRRACGVATVACTATLLAAVALELWPALLAACRKSAPEALDLALGALAEEGVSVVAMAAAAAAGFLVAFFLLRRDRAVWAFAALGAALAIASSPYREVRDSIVPAGERRRAAGLEAALMVRGQPEVHGYGRLPLGFLFYLDADVQFLESERIERLRELPVSSRLLISAGALEPFREEPGGPVSLDSPENLEALRLRGPLEGYRVRAAFRGDLERDRETVYLLEKTS